MIIHFDSGVDGWAEYVYLGTKTKPRNPEKVKIIDGDLMLTKQIYQNTKAKYTYDRIVLAFKGKIDNDKLKEIYEDFKRLFLDSYGEDEYNISAVVHQDTANSHIHICIPRLNLLTNTINTYYFDRQDRRRVNLIRDYLDLKYNLEQAKRLDNNDIKEIKDIERWESWRALHNQKKLVVSNRKKRRIEVIEKIKNDIDKAYGLGFISSPNDLYNFVNERFGFKVKTVIKSYNDEYYLLIENLKNGDKFKLTGGLYGRIVTGAREQSKEFELKSNTKRNDRGYSFINSKRINRNDESVDERLRRIKQEIDMRNKKYADRLNKRIGRTREQARKRVNELLQSSDELPQRNNNNIVIPDTSFQMKTQAKDDTFFPTERVAKSNSTATKIEELDYGRILRILVTAKSRRESRRLLQSNIIGRGDGVGYKTLNERLEAIRINLGRVNARINNFRRISNHWGKQMNTIYDDIKSYNLVDIMLNDKGILLNDKSSRNTKVVKMFNDEVALISNLNGRYLFYNTHTGKGGSILDYYLNEKNDRAGNIFKLAVKLKNKYNSFNWSENLPALTQEQLNAERQQTLDSINLTTLKDYDYFYSRGINFDTLKAFSVDRFKTNLHHNIYMPTYSFKNANSFAVSGYEIVNHNFKSIIGSKGLGLTKINAAKPYSLYVFESTLDAMSYYQLFKHDGVYVSLNGNPSEKQLIDLTLLCGMSREIILSMDNDSAGDKHLNKILAFLDTHLTQSIKMKPIDVYELARCLNLAINDDKIKDMNDLLILKSKNDIKLSNGSVSSLADIGG